MATENNLSLIAYYFFSKIKSHKEGRYKTVGIKVFSLFLLDDRRIREAQKLTDPDP
jgi:hypothetical protein